MITSASDITKAVAEAAQDTLVQQLSELVRRGLLLIKSTQPVLTIDDKNVLRISQEVELTVPEMEYIKKLESQIDRLRAVAEAAEKSQYCCKSYDCVWCVPLSTALKAWRETGK